MNIFEKLTEKLFGVEPKLIAPPTMPTFGKLDEHEPPTKQELKLLEGGRNRIDYRRMKK